MGGEEKAAGKRGGRRGRRGGGAPAADLVAPDAAAKGTYVPPNRRADCDPEHPIIGNATAKKGRGSRIGTAKIYREGRSRGRNNIAYALRKPKPRNTYAEVQLALECANLKVSCNLSKSCAPIACRRTMNGIESWVMTQAPKYMQSAMDAWATDEGRGCRVVEKPAHGISFQKWYFPLATR